MIQREYVSLMKSREIARTVYGQREQREKENRTAAGPTTGSSTDVNQRVSLTISAGYPATARSLRRIDTEEVFN